MSQKNLYCDQCGEAASVFALQPPLKMKACELHAVALMKKHPSIFTIDAYEFIETPEDYPEYVVRRNTVQKCRGSLTALQERCETNQSEEITFAAAIMLYPSDHVFNGGSCQHSAKLE